jgi:hypothetical protein
VFNVDVDRSITDLKLEIKAYIDVIDEFDTYTPNIKITYNDREATLTR